MTLSEQLEQEELETPEDERNILWSERIVDSKAARSAWDADYLKCEAVLSNNIPTSDKENGVSDFTDKLYKTNPAIPSLHWKKSLIQESDISFLLNGLGGVVFQDKDVLEKQLNYVWDMFKMTDETALAIYDKEGFGYGVNYTGWNGMAKSSEWKMGIPRHRNVHCRNFWVDPNSVKPDWSDRRWSIEKIVMDTNDAILQFPELKEHIDAKKKKASENTYSSPANTTEGDSNDKRGLIDVYLIQYRVLKSYELVESSAPVKNNGVTTKKTILSTPSELADFKTEIPADDMTMQNVTESEPFEVQNTEWFQFYYSTDFNICLTDPEHIGKFDHYSVMHAFKIAGDIYPRSTIYLTIDLIDSKVILLTKAILDVVSNGTPIIQEAEGSCANEADWSDNKYGMQPRFITKEEWQMSHPGEDPIKFTYRNVDVNMNVILSQIIDQYNKDMTGSVDAARGVSSGANVSGVKEGMLQSASQIYTKSDIISYRSFLGKAGQILLKLIAENREYEHNIPSITPDNQMTTEVVNPDNIVTWDWESYIVLAYVENNTETQKMLQEQKYNQWASAGWMTPLDMMTKTGEPDAVGISQRADQRNSIIALAQQIDKMGLTEQVMALVQGGEEQKSA